MYLSFLILIGGHLVKNDDVLIILKKKKIPNMIVKYY